MSELEWEVRHKQSSAYKGRGATPEAALQDLRDCFALGIRDAQEGVDREQKRLDRLSEISAETK